MTGQTIQLQQNTNHLNQSRIYGDFIKELSFLFEEKKPSLHDTIHDIITDFSKNINIEDIKKKIITTLHFGADINKANPEDKTPVMYLLEKAKELKGKYQDKLKQVARFLIERGASLNDGIAKGFMNQEERDSIHQSMKDWEEEVKGDLKDYIKNATIKEVSRYGSLVQVTLKNGSNNEEIEVGEFLHSDSLKKDEISGFSIVNEDGISGLHCAVYDGIKHYVVTNDCSYAMNLKWWVEGKECEITIKIDADGSVALIEGNGVIWEQLDAHKDVKLGDLFLADALRKGRWKDGLQQSEETIRSIELQQGQSAETIISVGRGIEANNEKNKTHFGHNKGPAPQSPKISSLGNPDEANNSERNVKTSTPNSNDAPLSDFNASPIPFNKTSNNQIPSHNLGILTNDYCEDTGKRIITHNNDSVAVIEDVHDEEGNDLRKKQTPVNDIANTVAAQAQSYFTYPLEGDKFASTIMKSTTSSPSYFPKLPPVNSFKPKQPPSVHTQQQQKAQDDDQTPVRANPPHYNHEEVLNEFDPFRNNNVEKTTEFTESEFPSDELQIDSGFSSPTHITRPAKIGHKSIVEEPSGLEGSTSGVSLKHVDPRGLSPRNERRLSEDGLREGYSINEHGRTEIFNSNNWPIHSSTTDSGFSSPRHSGSNESQIDQEHLENIARMLVELKEPDYNDAELSTEENVSIPGNQSSEWELECDSALDSDDEFKERDSGYIDDELTGDACIKLVSHEQEDEFLKIVDEAVDDAKARINGIEKNKQDYQISFPKKYGQTHGKTIKSSNLSLNQTIQGELKERFNQPNKGLKTVEETAEEASPSTKDYNLFLRQAREGLKTVEQTAKEISPSAKDYNPLLRQARKGLKTVKPFSREIQRINTNNQHLGYTEAKQFWEKRISQEKQEKQEKQQRKHEERGVLRS